MASVLFPKPTECGLGLKWSEFLALDKNALALLPTPLLRLFLSDAESGEGRPFNEVLLLRLSFRLGLSLAGADEERLLDGDEVGAPAEVVTPVMLPSKLGDVGELEPPPNILFSSPPDEEKLLRCLFASLPALKKSCLMATVYKLLIESSNREIYSVDGRLGGGSSGRVPVQS